MDRKSLEDVSHFWLERRNIEKSLKKKKKKNEFDDSFGWFDLIIFLVVVLSLLYLYLNREGILPEIFVK